MIEENTPLGCCCRGTIGFEAIVVVVVVVVVDDDFLYDS
jgi:hypothetical protein